MRRPRPKMARRLMLPRLQTTSKRDAPLVGRNVVKGKTT